ncbi:hypothetical protein RMCBS344292_06148 [Rhizopus microsporus]|nr:hypothetical protein RMCBS344292_06148 [Rhizopus microsporus]
MNDIKTQRIPIEYIFIDKQNELRSISKTLDFMPVQLSDIPLLYVDHDEQLVELIQKPTEPLIPVAMYEDPFRQQGAKLVLCQMPTRLQCKKIMDHYAHLEPWFGIEQEYVLFDPKTNKPLGWPRHGQPEKTVLLLIII